MEILPNVMVKYICSFLDLRSFASFSFTSKKYYKLFMHIPIIFKNTKKFFPNVNLNKSIQHFTQLKRKHGEETLLHLITKSTEKTIKPEMLKLLVECNADLNAKDMNGNRALECALKNHHISLDIIKFLFESKAELIDRNTNGLLHCAFEREHDVAIELIQYLIDKKCNLNALNSFGNTPLHFAARNKQISIESLRFILDQKADMNLKNYANDTVLHLLCKNESFCIDKIKLFVEYKSDLNLPNSIERIPLHCACENQSASFEIIQFLIDKKSDLLSNRVDSIQPNPLQLASKNEKIPLQVIEYLIEKKSQVHPNTVNYIQNNILLCQQIHKK